MKIAQRLLSGRERIAFGRGTGERHISQSVVGMPSGRSRLGKADMPIILAAIALVGLLAALGTVVVTSGFENASEILTGPIGWGIGITLVLAIGLGPWARRKVLSMLREGRTSKDGRS